MKRKKQNYRIQNLKKKLLVDNVTIISQNCIGGVFYHDMGLPFLSPTINLFFKADDFMKFVINLKKYLEEELIFEDNSNYPYPVGRLGDVEIFFMHYQSKDEALEKWNARKERIEFDNIVVFSTDRDGFGEDSFEKWKTIPYKKVLFTANKNYKGEGVVFFEKYEKLGKIPDLITEREFYKDNIIFSVINELK